MIKTNTTLKLAESLEKNIKRARKWIHAMERYKEVCMEREAEDNNEWALECEFEEKIDSMGVVVADLEDCYKRVNRILSWERRTIDKDNTLIYKDE